MASRKRATLDRKIDRLYWRAGFGPTAAERAHARRVGLDRAIHDLLNPRRRAEFVGPRPSVEGAPLSPGDQYGHDALWWLDRMVRTTAPLLERMTFNLHDHFATSNEKVGDVPLMLKHYATLRRHALGNFGKLTWAMTNDRAMQWWLDVVWSTKDSPNENFARELMELFTLGVGNYSEQDVREAARAFTGVTYDWDAKRWGYDPSLHDDGVKRVFGKSGRFKPIDIVRLCLRHPAHAPYVCRKLWGYFVPSPPPASTLRQMVRAYRRSDYEIRPVLEIVLHAPAFYRNLKDPDLVKPPAVYLAGMLRMTTRQVDRIAYGWGLFNMGQAPFYPPNVSGWESNEAWLSTMALKARSDVVTELTSRRSMEIKDDDVPNETAAQALAWAHRACGSPWISAGTRSKLLSLSAGTKPKYDGDTHYRAERRAILRHLLLCGPDAQVH